MTSRRKVVATGINPTTDKQAHKAKHDTYFKPISSPSAVHVVGATNDPTRSVTNGNATLLLPSSPPHVKFLAELNAWRLRCKRKPLIRDHPLEEEAQWYMTKYADGRGHLTSRVRKCRPYVIIQDSFDLSDFYEEGNMTSAVLAELGMQAVLTRFLRKIRAKERRLRDPRFAYGGAHVQPQLSERRVNICVLLAMPKKGEVVDVRPSALVPVSRTVACR